jgi:hypothetical protein
VQASVRAWSDPRVNSGQIGVSAGVSAFVSMLTRVELRVCVQQDPAAEAAASKAAAEASAAAEAAAADAAAALKARMNGKCVVRCASMPQARARAHAHAQVRYNHYDDEFAVVDGKLNWEHVDEKYAISFVFKGNWTCNLIEWVRDVSCSLKLVVGRQEQGCVMSAGRGREEQQQGYTGWKSDSSRRRQASKNDVQGGRPVRPRCRGGEMVRTAVYYGEKAALETGLEMRYCAVRAAMIAGAASSRA